MADQTSTRRTPFTVKYGEVGDSFRYTHAITRDFDEAKRRRDNWYDGGAWGGIAHDRLRVWVEDQSGAIVYGTDTENVTGFSRGDRVVTRQGRTGTVASVQRNSDGDRVYVRMDDAYGGEREYAAKSLKVANG